MATDVTVAVLFALEREAAPFRRAARGLKHVSIHVSGVGRARAREAAGRLLESRPSLVIAAGFCGALKPGLRVGDVVTSPHVSLLTSPREGEVAASLWTRRVGGEGDRSEQPPTPHPPESKTTPATSPARGEVKDRSASLIVTVDHLVTDSAEKRRLGEAHDAVDMESAAVAEACAAKGVPFVAVRAVSDTMDTALSPELVRLLSGGRVSALKACGALLRKPALAGEFLRLARDTKLAAQMLAEALVTVIHEARSREG